MPPSPQLLRKPPLVPQPVPLGLSNSRSLLTLLIVLHFICVATVLSSNVRRSALQGKLVSVFGIYTQVLCLDPDQTPYQFVTSKANSHLGDDCYFEIDLFADPNLAAGQQKRVQVLVLPQAESRYGAERRRLLNLGQIMSFNVPATGEAQPHEDAITAAIAKGIGQFAMQSTGTKRAVVKVIRRTSQPLLLDDILPGFTKDNPQAPEYNETFYTADVWFDGSGGKDTEVTCIKRATSSSQVAPLKTGS